MASVRTSLKVAVVGATGVVGREMVRVLEERNFPVASLRLFATSRSVGRLLPFNAREISVEETAAETLHGQDIILFAGGDDASRDYAWRLADSGAVVIDNSSTWRLDPRVPLVIPEVNAHALDNHRGLIANPNCCAVTLVMALAPLHRAAGIRRTIVSTYQSVSGGGADNITALVEQTRALLADGDGLEALSRGDLHRIEVLTGTRAPVAFNVLPQWKWAADGYTEEEKKIIAETHKIMDADFPVIPTTVRVPVVVGHTLAVHVELDRPLGLGEARRILEESSGIAIVDSPEQGEFPTPLLAAGQDAVYVGRFRRDLFSPNGLLFVAVGDNLRKGAALNAVQIAEELVARGLTRHVRAGS